MHHNAIADSAMWDSATTDTDAVNRRTAVVQATVALSGSWPFLAAAQSMEEFNHRLALIEEQVEQRVPSDVRTEVVAGLREKFATLQEEGLATTAMLHTAARTIALAEGEGSLPQSYIHVHKHGSGDDEYHQVDFIGGPTFLQTLGRSEDRDEALSKAREYTVAHKLPLYENGRYVEGRKLPLVQAGTEFFDAKTGQWIKASALPISKDKKRCESCGGSGEKKGHECPQCKGSGVAKTSFLQATAAQSWSAGGTGLHPAAGIADEAARARRDANWGEHLATNYQPDPDAGIRYHYGPPQRPSTPPEGGQPTAPDGSLPTANNPAAPTSIDSDGFPMDMAQGEYAGAAAQMQRQLTPGPWVVTPGSEWPVKPNAGHQGQEQVYASKQSGGGSVIPEAWKRGQAPTNWVMDDNGRPGRSVPHNDMARGVIDHLSGKGSPHESVELDDPNNPSRITITRNGEAIHWYPSSGHRSSSRRTAAQPGLAAILSQMENGDRRSVSANNGHSYMVGYNSEQAMGDDNRPAKGYTVGGYDVTHEQSGRSLGYYRHTPHGPTLEGAKRYAAEQAADTIARHARDQHGHHGSKTAGEGVVSTPGPNPNYFSTGTQGLQGPAQFPPDPGLDEHNNHQDGDGPYGDVPPMVSGGSSQGQVDGQGYSRSASLVLAPRGNSHVAVMYHGADEFLVGQWPSKQAAQRELDRYAEAYERAQHVTVTKRLASRLGFSQGAGERTAVRHQAHYEVEPRPGSVFHKASPTAVNEAFHVHEVASDSGFDSGFVPVNTGIHVHDYPQAIGELQNNWNVHDDNVADEYNSDKRRDSHRRREVGKLLDSLKARQPKQSASRDPYGDHMRQRQHEQPNFSNGTPKCPACYGRGVSGEDEQTCPSCGGSGQDERRRQSSLIDIHDRALNHSSWSPDENDVNTHWQRGHYDASNGRDYAGEENQDHPHARAYRAGWDHALTRTAATNGQIVGQCDHCKRPVRYHDDNDGHLQHLHNSSPYCQDGRKSTAMRLVEGGMEYRLPLPKQGAVLEAPTPENPTGRGGDDYRARTFDSLVKQRPLQSSEDRNANTPTLSPDPIKTGPNRNSPMPSQEHERDREDDDDEEDDDDDD